MPAPAAARPRCWSSASPGLCMRMGSASARSSRSRSPRRLPPSCASGFACACAMPATTRPRGRPRAPGSRRSMRSVRACCARTRWTAGSTLNSPCSTNTSRHRCDAPHSMRRSASVPGPKPGAELIAAYGPAALRTTIAGTYAELRARGMLEPTLPLAPPAPDPLDLRSASLLVQDLGSAVQRELGRNQRSRPACARRDRPAGGSGGGTRARATLAGRARAHCGSVTAPAH